MSGKVSIIGAGNVGASCAQRIAERDYADIVMMDIVEGLPQGKALDILESAPVTNFNSSLIGTNNYKGTANSDVVVVTSGLGRKPGMTRDELLQANMKIVTEVVRNVVKYSPDCIIVMVTNPVDVLTRLALNVSRFPRNRIVGLSGVLDSARLRYFIAAELKVPVEDVSAWTLGEHGNNMVIIPRLCKVSGKPLTDILSREAIDRLIKRTVGAGAEIVNLLKTGSAFYAPSAAIARMLDAIVLDKKEVLPCSAYLRGEYGIKDTVICVPVKLGRNGIEQIIEIELTADEIVQLTKSAEAVRQLVKTMIPGEAG
jgi:malate dehydrogenase